MKFLFIAPRFHTNQYEIVRSLIQRGHEVKFLTQYIGKVEDHSIITPYLIKKSYFTIFIHRLIDFVCDINAAENIKTILFSPAKVNLFNMINKYNPDIVILRERNFVSMSAYIICKLLKIKSVIIYNQSPLFTQIRGQSQRKIVKHITNILKKFLFPTTRITTVQSNNISEIRKNANNFYVKQHDYFIPFIAELKEQTANRIYCQGGKINILDVGKYRSYKNHFILIDAIDLIEDKSNINVTIAGQAANSEEIKYFNSLKEYIEIKKLGEVIKLEKNIDYNKMSEIYQSNDIFILTSKIESASISVLEAMANGLITISTNANGTASYILEGECGYLFHTNDKEDLANKIQLVINNRNNISQMGKNAYLNIKNNYSFDNYYSSLTTVLRKEFGLVLFD